MSLSADDIALFFKMMWSLLAYANQHLKVVPPVAGFEEVSKRPIEQVARMRDALDDNLALLERFLAENPQGFSSQELAIVASWRHRVRGDFYILRFLKPYAVFLSSQEPTHLYGVQSLSDPLEVVLGSASLPVAVQATLLPFRGGIVYDGLMKFYRLTFGGGIRSRLNNTYSRLKEREGIIEQLTGPAGEPQVRTSLSRKVPAKSAPDWRPAIDEIVARVEKMRRTDTRLRGAAFGLLRAAAGLAQAAFSERDAEAEAIHFLRPARAALTKLEKLLFEEPYD